MIGPPRKQSQSFADLSQCFKYIVNDPPRPLTEEDIWFQIGHVHEQQKDVSIPCLWPMTANSQLV
jgi:hypothetical protein